MARAPRADPPVLLVDEPFGAVDPVVRERPQNELLRLQQPVRKTVLFVTHDIEALRRSTAASARDIARADVEVETLDAVVSGRCPLPRERLAPVKGRSDR